MYIMFDSKSCFSKERFIRKVHNFRFKQARTCLIIKNVVQGGGPLPGAVFELRHCERVIATCISDACGTICFKLKPMCEYTIEEILPSPGYQPFEHIFRVRTDLYGRICVDGMSCNCIKVCNRRSVILSSFTALKLNLADNTPISGAKYTLFSSGRPVAVSISNSSGELTFTGLEPGHIYTIFETSTPPEFQAPTDSFIVEVTLDGSVSINGYPANGYQIFNIPLYRLLFEKRDAGTDDGLPGVTFELSQNGGVVAIAISGFDGIVDFGLLSPGSYELREIAVPPNYIPNPISVPVEVSLDGSITIAGIDLSLYVAENVAFPGIMITKLDSGNNQPLAGATFTLFQNNIVVQTSVTDSLGITGFSALAPGNYELEETTPPIGYLQNPTVYDVVVSPNGEVKIDGIITNNLIVSDDEEVIEQSPVPTINNIYEIDTRIIGSGVPGCQVTVIWPNGEVSNAIVGSNGLWVSIVPNNVNLMRGQLVYAYQTCSLMLPSEQVNQVVLAIG